MFHMVGQFEKVSYDQFRQAVDDTGDNRLLLVPNLRENYEQIKLPKRSTSGSAGYDFVTPFTFALTPGQTIMIPTGIRCRIDEGWWLGCFPRSGLGFKFRLQLNNTVGIIDSDYYYGLNEGHIFARITNDSNEGKVVHLTTGDRFMQGVFIPFGITYDDDAKEIRHGGMGSTGS